MEPSTPAGPLAFRSTAGRIFDVVLFPIRALFMGPRGYFGLSSLQDERMRVVARHCRGRVLDIGCGPHNTFVNCFLAPQQGVGIDVYPYEGVTNVIDDPTNLPFPDASFDTVSLIAVGGHIPRSKRVAEFREFARVLKPGGRLIMTEGEPVTQYLVHAWGHFYSTLIGKKQVDYERGMEQDEEFCMPRGELMRYLSTPPFRFLFRRRFMWGLNNVYVAQRQPDAAEAAEQPALMHSERD
jgi:SAM-dependent methyltransferase